MENRRQWKLIYLSCLVLILKTVSGSQEIMTKLAIGFTKVVVECKNELNIEDNVMQELSNFWKEDYELVNRDLGCIILCMSKKHNLISDDMKMHHGNAKEFAIAHGADAETATQLIEMLHECEKSNADILDSCAKTLEIAKCFRTKIHELKWAPNMDTILAEILNDM